MEVKVPGTEENTAAILRDVLDEWRAGIAAHDPQRVSSVFTEDTIFQGLRPYSVGRPGVFDYYESQPVGLTVDYRIHETRRPADNVVLGYLRADFTRPDGTVIPLNLSVLVTRDDDWRIAHYQVSAVTN
ncbi:MULTISPECIES: SgcJ/EcaC family oxidoreductase [Mycobacteriaceae]|uniref:SgcJ/EcaC family oxidoreductase n=1 Tax=Mycolicibacterium nivoides TaxID=2487344 RepID=UPI000B8039B5|nr:SgcJ/EcaC family oxidoreductase [Mycolicibacterium septicum]